MAVRRKAVKKQAATKKPVSRKRAAGSAAAGDKWLVRTGEVAGEAAKAFAALRAILAKHEHSLVVKDDRPGRYYLNTAMPHPRGQGATFFGAAVVMKSYVSFHLMPVYAFPVMMKDASSELKQRMQGKSCFNFRRMEPALFRELDALTREGLKRFQAAGLA